MYFLIIAALVLIVPMFVVLWNLTKQASPYKTVLRGVLATAFAVLCVLAVAKSADAAPGQQFLYLAEQAARLLAQTDEFVSAAGVGDLSYDERVELLVSAYGTVNSLFPSVILILSAVNTYFLYMWFASLYRGVGGQPKPLPPLKNFSWPHSLMLGFFIMLILGLAADHSRVFAELQLYLNVSILFEFVVMVQGIAVVLFFCAAKRIPKAAAVITSVLGMAFGIGRMGFFFIGAIDYMVNLRVRISQR